MKTTSFRGRDFLAEIAGACRRRGLPLVIYFNAISDGNPEFDEWSLLDRQGKPIVFSPGWPTRYQMLHSPFRQKCLEQVREGLEDYEALSLLADLVEKAKQAGRSVAAGERARAEGYYRYEAFRDLYR